MKSGASGDARRLPLSLRFEDRLAAGAARESPRHEAGVNGRSAKVLVRACGLFKFNKFAEGVCMKLRLSRLGLWVAILLLAVVEALGQQSVLAPPDNLVLDNVPAIPAALAETAGRYNENRSAFLLDWHPQHREMLIRTRFGSTYQTHLVKMPAGARQQLTFFTEPVHDGSFQPRRGDYFVFSKDVGGGEWYQLFRYDFATRNSTLLTDGKSRNLPGR
jgi:hypothetical protein